MDLTALLEEWHSGRDARGEESSRFASRWTTVAGLRSYAPHIDDLAPAITAAAEPYTLDGVSARFATGADSADEIRIELTPILDYELVVEHRKTVRTTRRVVRLVVKKTGPAEMTRWRPTTSLEHVRDRNGKRRGPQFDAAKVSRAMALDVVKAELPDTHEALSEMKRRRNVLRDMEEAGADVGAEIAALAAKDAEVRAEHDAMNLERKRELVAQDLENIDAAIDKLATVDLDILSRQEQLDTLALQRDRAIAMATRIDEKLAIARPAEVRQ